ncbi:MAG: hypothetical protein AAGB51_14205 [Planctomycetota bacterium]
MIRKLLSKLGMTDAADGGTPPELPPIDPTVVSFLFTEHHGLPQVDWGMADAWISNQLDEPSVLRRAIASHWLDKIAHSAPGPMGRWRTHDVEGLAPDRAASIERVGSICTKSLRVVSRALTRITSTDQIEPIAVVALPSNESYYDFLAYFSEGDDHEAASGGVYLSPSGPEYPCLALKGGLDFAFEEGAAHELTHHLLRACGLPLWAEEGLTQMMEERVTSIPGLTFTSKRRGEHAELWSEYPLASWAEGDAFFSPEGEVQTFSYELSEALTRSLLAGRPNDFFAFAKACRETDPDLAARKYLGASAEELAADLLGIGAEPC